MECPMSEHVWNVLNGFINMEHCECFFVKEIMSFLPIPVHWSKKRNKILFLSVH